MPSASERVREIEQAGLEVAAIEQNLERIKEEYKNEKLAYKVAVEKLKAFAKPLPLFDGKEES